MYTVCGASVPSPSLPRAASLGGVWATSRSVRANVVGDDGVDKLPSFCCAGGCAGISRGGSERGTNGRRLQCFNLCVEDAAEKRTAVSIRYKGLKAATAVSCTLEYVWTCRPNRV